jgi:hypothetical protein
MMVFAKAPVPGRVKTRLAPLVDADRAAELHLSFVKDVLSRLEGFADRADIELHTDIPCAAWPEFPGPRRLQPEGDLGVKMYTALLGALAAGRPQAIIVGADSPNLPQGHLEALLAAPADVALGPAEDGGYYAIAARRAHPAMFKGVPWSTDKALEETIAAVRRAGLSVELAPEWYDVDSPEDLLRLARESTPPHTRAWLKKHGFLAPAAHL